MFGVCVFSSSFPFFSSSVSCLLIHFHLISVSVVPTLVLDLGSNLNPEDIEEGDDVYFECKVHANPAAYKVIWKHNVSTLKFILWNAGLNQS